MFKTFSISLLAASSQAIKLRNMTQFGFSVPSVADVVPDVVPTEVTDAATTAVDAAVPAEVANQTETAVNATASGDTTAMLNAGADVAGADSQAGQVLTIGAENVDGVTEGVANGDVNGVTE